MIDTGKRKLVDIIGEKIGRGSKDLRPRSDSKTPNLPETINTKIKQNLDETVTSITGLYKKSLNISEIWVILGHFTSASLQKKSNFHAF